MPEAFPRLRGEIDAAPASRDGENYYILYDRSGVAASRLLVSPLGLLIAGRLDGTLSLLDISDNLSREYGGGISCSDVEKIVDALEDALFLETPGFFDFQEQAARDFRSAPFRSPTSAGSAYNDDPAVLRKELDRFLLEAPPPEESFALRDRHPRGVIAPHIDFLRGGLGYGQIYRLLAALPAPRTVVIIGTAHMPLQEQFSLCEKAFETPLGTLDVDGDLCRRIRLALGSECSNDCDILAHRGEHSVELQTVWLRHIYGGDVRIVPLLAGSVSEFLDGGRQPGEADADPAFRKLSACLSDVLREGDVMLMASADLAHVGPRFGDEQEVTNQFLAEVEEVDRQYLAAVAEGATAGLENLASHGDRHHICGSACIFAMRQALGGSQAALLGYHQAVTPEMRQAVTYAAMAFE